MESAKKENVKPYTETYIVITNFYCHAFVSSRAFDVVGQKSSVSLPLCQCASNASVTSAPSSAFG